MSFLLLLFPVFISSANGGSCGSLTMPLTYNKIETFSKCKGFKHVDEVMPFIPKEFLSRFVMVFDSGSRHGASYSEPRILALDPEGDLILAFNGSDSQDGGNLLEMLEGTEEMTLKQIEYEKGSKAKGVHYSANATSQCLGCHNDGMPGKMDPYPTWSKMYGSFSHAVFSGSEEALSLADFLEKGRLKGRYKYLVFPPRMISKEYISSLREPTGRPVLIEAATQNEHDPITLLTLSLYRKNAIHIAKQFASKESPYHYALSALILGCFPTCQKPANNGVHRCETLAPPSVEEYLPEGVAAKGRRYAELYNETMDLNQKNIKYRYRDVARTNKSEQFSGYYGSQDDDPAYIGVIANLRFLAERLGIDDTTWSLAINNQEARDYSFAANTSGIDAYKRALLQKVVGVNPEIRSMLPEGYRKSYLAKASKNDEFFSFLSPFTDKALADVCVELKKKSLAAFAKKETNGGSCPTPKTDVLTKTATRCIDESTKVVPRK